MYTYDNTWSADRAYAETWPISVVITMQLGIMHALCLWMKTVKGCTRWRPHSSSVQPFREQLKPPVHVDCIVTSGVTSALHSTHTYIRLRSAHREFDISALRQCILRPKSILYSRYKYQYCLTIIATCMFCCWRHAGFIGYKHIIYNLHRVPRAHRQRVLL